MLTFMNQPDRKRTEGDHQAGAPPRSLIVLSLLLLLGFIYYAINSIQTRGIFDYVGLDFRTFHSSGTIARVNGFASVYDLERQDSLQRTIYDRYAIPSVAHPYAPVPTPYLPIFIIPFWFISLLDPIPGFLLWSVFNLVGFTFYIRRLANTVEAKNQWTFLHLVSLPFVLNLIFGQVNLWLLICLGEFLIWCRRKSELTGGVWLSGLLLKPQVLIFIIPGLFLARRWKALGGIMLGSIVFAGVSLILAGVQGMNNLFNLLVKYPSNLATTYPESMMNWRSVGVNLAVTLDGDYGWILVGGGMLVTSILATVIWVHYERRRSLVLHASSAYAAASLISWHSHIHMALPLSTLFLLTRLDNKIERSAFLIWILLPSVSFLAAGLIVSFGLGHLIEGQVFFVLNLLITIGVFYDQYQRGRSSTYSSEG